MRRLLPLLVLVVLASTLFVYRSYAAQTPQPVSKPAQGILTQASPTLLNGVAGMPPYNPQDIYSFTRAGMLSPAVKGVPERVYVPDGKTNRVYIIDPKTYTVLSSHKVDAEPQHVVPSYDLKTLYAVNDVGNTITPIDPRTARFGKPIPIQDPYNLYFTPNGKYAMVVAEYQHRLDFFNPQTWKRQYSLKVPCSGINHIDYSPDGRYLIAGCEFSGDILKIDWQAPKVLGKMHVGGMPQDVKLSPDGKVFYVADMKANGLHLVDGDSFKKLGFIATGSGAHGLYPSRDGKYLYISNRAEGSVSVLDFATRKLVTKWRIPQGGSPDMGGVSPDGSELWLTGRYSGEVYVFNTDIARGGFKRRIKVGIGPHGLAIFPQPGRYSLGHTGILR